jgi:rSAM/selenodomain-associated transferase 1
MDRALLVMAKEPLAGMTKTRLSPPLSGQETAALYRCFLSDTLELMRRIENVEPIVAYHPPEAEPFFRRFAPPGFDFIPQEGADLGERLDNVLAHCLQTGYRQAVAMDSDSPTLPAAYVQQAFSELDDPAVDVVLGPCDDGGYYLIGLKSPCSALFRGVAMSTPTVVQETWARARDQGLHVACLPSWYDIDTYQDLTRLAKELSSLPASVAHHTRAFLSHAHATLQGDLSPS